MNVAVTDGTDCVGQPLIEKLIADVAYLGGPYKIMQMIQKCA